MSPPPRRQKRYPFPITYLRMLRLDCIATLYYLAHKENLPMMEIMSDKQGCQSRSRSRSRLPKKSGFDQSRSRLPIPIPRTWKSRKIGIPTLGKNLLFSFKNLVFDTQQTNFSKVPVTRRNLENISCACLTTLTRNFMIMIHCELGKWKNRKIRIFFWEICGNSH